MYSKIFLVIVAKSVITGMFGNTIHKIPIFPNFFLKAHYFHSKCTLSTTIYAKWQQNGLFLCRTV